MVHYEDKEKLIQLSENFFEKARDANCFFNIVKQFRENKNTRQEDMEISSAFYSYTENALIVAVVMELSKLYDQNRQSINIKKLLDICYKNRMLFPESQELSVSNYSLDEILKVPYKRTILPEEKEFFEIDINNTGELESLLLDNGSLPTVEMTVDRYFDLFYWKYDNLEPKIDYLIKQRNKVYAHNDEDKLHSIDEIIKEYPIYYKDIEQMISYALEISGFSIAMLTGVNKAKLPDNIGDWENTLNLLSDGQKYQKEQFEKEFGEGNF